MKKTFCGKLMAFAVLCSLFPMGAYATQEKIDKVQEGIEDLKKQKEEAKQKAEELSQEAGGLEGDLAEFHNRLTKVTEELNETERELASTQQSLEETRTALEKARKRERLQYEAMKKRIRFLYEEMDGETVLKVLVSAENFADFLNRTEYFANIQQYDRSMLDAYKATKEEIAGREQDLESQEKALARLKTQQEGKMQELSELVADTSEHLKAAKKQLAAAQSDMTKYEAEIERQKAYEAQLEAQKAREDAERLEEIKRQEEEVRRQRQEAASRKEETGGESGANESNSSARADASDASLLAALIECEAGGESYEGKIAVGSVVMNRVRSSHFPNTVAGVIYQGGQFSPVASGRFASVLARGANQSCVKAAGEVLGGNITLNCLYFRRNDGSIPGTVIGNHVFY